MATYRGVQKLVNCKEEVNFVNTTHPILNEVSVTSDLFIYLFPLCTCFDNIYKYFLTSIRLETYQKP